MPKEEKQMINLSVFCPKCGKRLRRMVDENFPPSGLRCTCGIRFPLFVEPEEERFDFCGDEAADVSSQDEAVSMVADD